MQKCKLIAMGTVNDPSEFESSQPVAVRSALPIGGGRRFVSRRPADWDLIEALDFSRNRGNAQARVAQQKQQDIHF